MLAELLKEAPVDWTRSGVLTISLTMLESMFALPPGTEFSDCFLNSGGDSIEVLVLGKEMPSRATGTAIDPVILIAVTKQANGYESVYFHWSHRPESEWLVSQRRLKEPAAQAPPMDGYYWVRMRFWDQTVPPAVARYQEFLGWFLPSGWAPIEEAEVIVLSSKLEAPVWPPK